MNRETYKDITISERNFRIKKFDALTGSYIAYSLMAETLPMGVGKLIGLPEQKSEIKKMSKQDFRDLQMDCLKVCSEKLTGGMQPIFDEGGNWAVIGLESDAVTVLALTIQALIFNVKSFFTESLLTSLSGAMSDMTQQNSPT